MKQAYINSPDSETAASTYHIKIEYYDGGVWEQEEVNYSYSRIFDLIKERHEDEKDRKVKSIKIDLVR